VATDLDPFVKSEEVWYTEGQAAAIAEETAIFALLRHFIDGALDVALTRWPDEYAFDYLVGTFEGKRTAWLEENPSRRIPASPKKAKITPALRRQVFERDAYRCVNCGSWEDLACDHILAESKGGPTEFENLQTLCRSCNSRKGTK